MKPDKTVWKWVNVMNKCNKGSFRIKRLKFLDGLTWWESEGDRMGRVANEEWLVIDIILNLSGAWHYRPRKFGGCPNGCGGQWNYSRVWSLFSDGANTPKFIWCQTSYSIRTRGPGCLRTPEKAIPIQGVFVRYERRVPQGFSTSSQRIICSDTKLQCKVN